MVMPLLVAPVDGEVAYVAAGAMATVIGVLWRQFLAERAQNRADLREVLTAMHGNTTATERSTDAAIALAARLDRIEETLREQAS